MRMSLRRIKPRQIAEGLRRHESCFAGSGRKDETMKRPLVIDLFLIFWRLDDMIACASKLLRQPTRIPRMDGYENAVLQPEIQRLSSLWRQGGHRISAVGHVVRAILRGCWSQAHAATLTGSSPESAPQLRTWKRAVGNRERTSPQLGKPESTDSLRGEGASSFGMGGRNWAEARGVA